MSTQATYQQTVDAAAADFAAISEQMAAPVTQTVDDVHACVSETNPEMLYEGRNVRVMRIGLSEYRIDYTPDGSPYPTWGASIHANGTSQRHNNRAMVAMGKGMATLNEAVANAPKDYSARR